MAITHVAFGAASALLTIKWLNVHESRTVLMFLAGGAIGSLLPDIDHPKSWLGRRIPFISIPLSNLVGHRGITHSMIALIVVQSIVLAAIAYLRATQDRAFAAPFLIAAGIGYASHLVADWMSNTGIPLLWPNRDRFAAPITLQTGSAAEYLIAFGIYVWFGVNFLRWFGHA
ncbi:metal-dependent hydrolase [Sulfuricystis multivorans]|uniref:metal-dependent hydrolase n=1 Tax=Sulfuricystis multivorans TaxID=2211108 RepID=UPI0024E01D4F|nr:metal-dependent hydrolase [Sulfuricystis multivorans]